MNVVNRLGAAWRALQREQRLAALAALALFVTMFLPWYSRSAVGVNPRTGEPVGASAALSAFEVFSFVEAAVLLVAIAVLVLCFARAERRAFHLPFGDGPVIMAAGLWVCLLVFWRQFDQPDASPTRGVVAETGVSWGIFVTFLAGALLAYAGYRIRAAHVPEPPLRTGDRREEAPTRRLAPDEAPTTHLRDDRPRGRAPRGAPPPIDGGEQLSFDE